jgi:hypothetical protein
MSVVFGNSSGRIGGLVQRALRDAGFKAAPVHVAILDKGQRSVKGLNSAKAKLAGLWREKVAQTDPSGENAPRYIISERPMSEQEWERERCGE